MVIDTSALIAVLDKEPDYVAFATAMHDADSCVISALTVYEASIVMLGRRGPPGIDDLRSLLTSIEAEITPFTDADCTIATAAYIEFGKGRQTKASLNLCDCAAYGLAKSRGAALLYKGDDFGHTDITPSAPSARR
jgi:ribonuclease VapC